MHGNLGPSCACGRPADVLCDFKIGPGQRYNCSAPICEFCTTSPVPGLDYCQEHYQGSLFFEAADNGRTVDV